MRANQTPTSVPWKERLYDKYVSSGQAGTFAANAEQTFRPRKAYINHLIETYFPKDRSAEILDLGCGHGAFLYFLAKAGYKNASGVDTSPEQITKAHEFGITTAHCRPAFEYIRSLQSESLDMVLLFDILEHLERQELFDLLDEVHRVLRPSGSCLVHVPNGEGVFGMRIRFGDLTHVQAFTQNSARQLLTTVGFSQVHSYEERPVVHGTVSLVRRVLWQLGTLHLRLLFAAETGSRRIILSQNLLAQAVKPRGSE
ncbi:MAG TPA: class I SAM-dependent methyltransferase [Silvibacterium sp.]|nr:class I SAM-dependent methyltransferase [Silvibacterium sp.]